MTKGLRLSHLCVVYEAKLFHQCPKFWIRPCIALGHISQVRNLLNLAMSTIRMPGAALLTSFLFEEPFNEFIKVNLAVAIAVHVCGNALES